MTQKLSADSFVKILRFYLAWSVAEVLALAFIMVQSVYSSGVSPTGRIHF